MERCIIFLEEEPKRLIQRFWPTVLTCGISNQNWQFLLTITVTADKRSIQKLRDDCGLPRLPSGCCVTRGAGAAMCHDAACRSASQHPPARRALTTADREYDTPLHLPPPRLLSAALPPLLPVAASLPLAPHRSPFGRKPHARDPAPSARNPLWPLWPMTWGPQPQNV